MDEYSRNPKSTQDDSGAMLAIAAAARSAPLGTGMTYQGQLKRGGGSVDDVCTFQLTLWDAASNGMLVAGLVMAPGVMVSDWRR